MTRYTITALILSSTLALVGCKTVNGGQQGVSGDRSSVEAMSVEDSLSKSANRVSEALQRLSMIEQQRNPVQPAGSAFTPDMPPEFGIPVTLTWTGPADQATAVIAGQIGWTFRIMGNKPQTPVIVAFDARGIPAVDVLRDIGLQVTSSGAAVVLDGAARMIEFRYQAR